MTPAKLQPWNDRRCRFRRLGSLAAHGRPGPSASIAVASAMRLSTPIGAENCPVFVQTEATLRLAGPFWHGIRVVSTYLKLQPALYLQII